MEGAFYNFSVNGYKMNSVTPGNSISAALSVDQIKKAKQEDNSKDEVNKFSVSSKDEAVPEKKIDKSLPNQKSISNAKVVDQKNKTFLPQTGDSAVSILSLVGFVMLGVSSLLIIAKKTLNHNSD